jgi:outer membrane protein assembly factor BamA
VLEEGQYRLAKNEVNVVNDPSYNTSDISKYIRQKPNSYFIFGWNPFLNLYNLGGKKDNFVSRTLRKIGVAPVVFDQNEMNSSVENIANHLEFIGYYGSKVAADVKVKDKKAVVTYEVTLGKRYPIKDIEFSLPDNEEFAADFYADTSNLSVKRGDYLSESALETESERSAEHMRSLGYYGFNKNYYFFEADTLLDKSSALLEMKINEYTRNENPDQAQPFRKYYFGDVSITYPKDFKIREKTLRHLNMIRTGDPYNDATVKNTYNRFASLPIFGSVNAGLSSDSVGVVNCDINLTPSRPQGFKVNLEASTNSDGLLGISPQLSYFHKNIFHGGQQFRLSFMGDFQFKPNHKDVRSTEFGVSTGIIFPRFIGLPDRLFKRNLPKTEIQASYNYQDRPEYKRNIISVAFGYVGSHGNFYYQIYPIQDNIVRLFSIDPDFYASLSNNPFLRNAYQDHFDLGSGATLYYTTNSSTNPKTSYWYTRFSVNVAGNMLSLFNSAMDKDENGSRLIWNTPYSQYVRGELTLGKTWRFGKNDGSAFATRLLAGAGYAYGNSSALPFEQHFYAGGANSMRGWQARSLGPGLSKPDSTFVIQNQTGDIKFEANMEYRFPMFWKFDGAIFIDAGNIWNYKSDAGTDGLGELKFNTFGESIAIDWGLGLRLDLNFILVRLDMGMRVHDPAQDAGERWRGPGDWLSKDGYAVHFGVGYPF